MDAVLQSGKLDRAGILSGALEAALEADRAGTPSTSGPERPALRVWSTMIQDSEGLSLETRHASLIWIPAGLASYQLDTWGSLCSDDANRAIDTSISRAYESNIVALDALA